MLFNGAKKGQFYILTATILCLATYTALSHANVPNIPEDKKFDDVVNNFIIEAPKVINYAIYHGHNITNDFEGFETDYLNYLESVNMDLGIIYIIHIDDNLYVKNLYNQTIIAENSFYTYDLSYSQLVKLPKTPTITIHVDNEQYSFDISEFEKTELKLLFIKKK